MTAETPLDQAKTRVAEAVDRGDGGHDDRVPALEQRIRGKRERYAAYAERASRSLETYLAGRDDLFGADRADA